MTSSKHLLRHAQRLTGAALLGLALDGAAAAQTSNPPPGASPAEEFVTWTISAPTSALRPGSRLTLTLSGVVRDGWHVYSLEQLPDGPTPLRVSLDPTEVATAQGAPSGSPAIKAIEPGINLETQYYARPFTVTLPVRVGSLASPGQQRIPVSVRFQTCNGRICHAPKTVRLSALINVQPAE
jgi:hypothetical protein